MSSAEAAPEAPPVTVGMIGGGSAVWGPVDLVEMASRRKRHVLVSPFVHLAPTFRAVWTRIRQGAIGDVHSAGALYGNLGSVRATPSGGTEDRPSSSTLRPALQTCWVI